MESSPYTEETLDIFETLWQQGYHNAGVVLQSYLRRARRTCADEHARRARAAREGRVQGTGEVAFQAKADVDATFMRIMRVLLPRAHTRPSRRTTPR